MRFCGLHDVIMGGWVLTLSPLGKVQRILYLHLARYRGSYHILKDGSHFLGSGFNRTRIIHPHDRLVIVAIKIFSQSTALAVVA